MTVENLALKVCLYGRFKHALKVAYTPVLGWICTITFFCYITFQASPKKKTPVMTVENLELKVCLHGTSQHGI
jgi:hypothetical protein